MTLEQNIAARANVILSEENDALIEENKRLKEIIRRCIPAIALQWQLTGGGPKKSNLLALRREVEEATGASARDTRGDGALEQVGS